MDFTRDSLANGRKFRTLNLMDGYTREALWIEVATSLPGLRVVQVLERVAQERGFPETIQVDNGPEFISRVMDQWAYANGVELHFIDPGKPVQNAFINRPAKRCLPFKAKHGTERETPFRLHSEVGFGDKRNFPPSSM